MERPNPNEWQKQNPGKTLHDYYKTFPPVSIHIHDQVSDLPLVAKNNSPSNTNKSIISGSIAGITGIGGYFLPWFKIPLLNIGVSGSDVSQLIHFVSDMDNSSLKVNEMLEYLYLLPVAFFSVVLASLSRNFILAAIPSLIAIIMDGFLLINLYKIPHIVSFGGIGLYLLSFSFVGVFWHLFVLSSRKEG